MASGPATPSLPLAARALDGSAAATPSPVVTGTIKEYKTPVDSEQKRRASRFSALRKVVQWKELEIAELCEVNGLGACLKAMADSEVNPIITNGAFTTANHA